MCVAIAKGVGDVLDLSTSEVRHTKKVRKEFKHTLKHTTIRLAWGGVQPGPALLFLEDLCYISCSGSPSATFSQF